MSKIVVGMNSKPAIIPHRIDCGFRKTVFIETAASLSQSSRRSLFGGAGSRRTSSALTARPTMPIVSQKLFQETPAAIAGPTRNWPAAPPAMPNICVAPMSVAARDAGKLVDAI